MEWVPVAIWECTRMMKRKDFVIATLLIPLLMGGVVFTIGWIKTREARAITKIAVVRLTGGGDSSATAGEISMPLIKGFEWNTPPAGERDSTSLAAAVRKGTYAGAVVIPGDFAEGGRVWVTVRSRSPEWQVRLRDGLLAEARRQRAAAFGLDTASLARLDRPLVMSQRLANPAVRSTGADRVASGVIVMLLITALFTTNSYMAIGISGEKQARVTEVIVSAIRPQSWIDGKIVAYTVIGLIQFVLWGGTLVAILLMSGAVPPQAIHPGALVTDLAFAGAGLCFYVALWAMVLATIKDLMSSSKFQAYLLFLPMAPFAFLESVIRSPDAPWIVAMSLIPLFSPMLMPARLTLGAAAGWEVAVALVLLAVAAWLMRIAGGHAFRIGMLMYGKEVTLPELWRWAREK